MNRIFTLFFLIIMPALCYAQKHSPNYEEIKQKTTDPASVYYYPALMNRYKAHDTTLLKDEYRYLYYGSFFAKEKIEDVDLGNNAEKRSKLLSQEQLTDKEKQKVIEFSAQILDKNPFDLRSLNVTSSMYAELGDTINSNIYRSKLRRIISTILSTGDGLTPETGIHVSQVSHEYVILAVFGYEFTSQTLIHDPVTCDYLAVKSNKDNVAGIYFNVSQIFEGYNDMFKDIKLTLPGEKKEKKRGK